MVDPQTAKTYCIVAAFKFLFPHYMPVTTFVMVDPRTAKTCCIVVCRFLKFLFPHYMPATTFVMVDPRTAKTCCIVVCRFLKFLFPHYMPATISDFSNIKCMQLPTQWMSCIWILEKLLIVSPIRPLHPSFSEGWSGRI